MPFRASFRRWLTWLILWVVGLAVLAPTVSRALPAPEPGAASWVEVCTSTGVQWVQLDTDAAQGADGEAPGSVGVDRCPLCVLMGDRLAPAPALPALAPVSAAPAPLPVFLTKRGYRAHRYLAAAPRGPPLSA